MKLKTGKKSGLKYFSINDIRSWQPCYNPNRYLSEDFRGTAIDILRNESIPFQDRLWVVCRKEIASDKLLRLFAVWCYRQTLIHTPNQDPRSIEAANVAERYANGEATEEELRDARLTAESVARAGTGSVAAFAAWTAESAAWAVGEAAAETASRSALLAARAAVWAGAREASWSVPELVYAAARSTIWASTWSAAKVAQKDKLIEMLISEGKERVKGKYYGL